MLRQILWHLKIPQVPSSVLTALGLYSQSFRILNAVESSVALSNYYIETTFQLSRDNLNWIVIFE